MPWTVDADQLRWTYTPPGRAVLRLSSALADGTVLRLTNTRRDDSIRVLVWGSFDGGEGMEIGILADRAVARLMLDGTPITEVGAADFSANPTGSVQAGQFVVSGVSSISGLRVGAQIRIEDGLVIGVPLLATIVKIDGSSVVLDRSIGNTTLTTPTVKRLHQPGNLWTTATDTPASSIADVSNNVPNGTDLLSYEVRYVGGVAELWIVNAAAPLLRVTAPARVAGNNVLGLVGNLSGTTPRPVERVELYTQTSVEGQRADILVVIAAGQVWYSTTPSGGGAMSAVGPAVFPPTAAVDIEPMDGQMLMVGGGKAYKYDPGTGQVLPWSDTQDPDVRLPGASAGGTTTATIVRSWRDRAILAGMSGDPQNVVGSAVGDVDDWDTGSDIAGSAFALGGARAGKVGEPIVALQQTTSDSFLVGCTGSVYEVQGDPALGQTTTLVRSWDTGISGKDATWLTNEGVCVAHSPVGLVLFVGGAPAVNLTQPTLTSGITLNETQLSTTTVLVIRDAERRTLHAFLTPATGSGLHFAYDERVGEYQPGAGGLHPDTYPESMQPTAATLWNGRLVMGCKDGGIRYFDDGAKDDDGQLIDFRASFSPLNLPDAGNETILRGVRVVLSSTSDAARVRVWGGDTLEDAYDLGRRTLLFQALVPPRTVLPWMPRVRTGALVVELGSAGSGTRPVVEVVEVDVRAAQRRTT